jgi:hypothetical protein
MKVNEEIQEILAKRADRYDGKKETRIERYHELAQKHEAQCYATQLLAAHDSYRPCLTHWY